MNKFVQKSLIQRVVAGVLLSALLQLPAFAAADRAVKASEFYEDALVRMDRNDTKGAIIQLKNALQQDGKNLPALVLLGKAYLKAGQPLGADRVLTDAESLGADRSEIIAYQAEAYNQLGRNKQLLDLFSPNGLPPLVKYKVLVIRAYAQMDIGKEPVAIQSAEEARKIDPNNPSALVAESMAYLRMNNFPDAGKAAEQAITVGPNDPIGWNMKASIAHARGDVKEALAGYGKALTLEPKYLDALIGRASLLLDLNRNDEAARDVAVLKKNFADDPRSSYLQALVAGRKGNNIEVRDALVAATSALDALPFEAVQTKPQLLLLGGVSHYSLGQIEKAKTYLGAYLEKYPRHMGALKLLASIMMSQGKYAQTIALLEGPARATPNDPQALSMLATCYMALKQHTKAVSLLQMATELNGGTAPDITANFGLSLIGSGQVEQGVAQLQKAYAISPGRAQSGVPLALMYMKQGKTKSAIQILQTILKKEPDNLTALNILGIARGLSGDTAGARKTYLQVLAKDGGFTPATLNLARLDLYEGKPDDARARLMAILKDQPKNLDAFFELAQVELYSKRPKEAIRWLEKARSYNPQNLRPNLMLIDLYLDLGDAQKALGVAQDAQSASRDNLQALAALGRAYLAVGNLEMAKQNFRQITQVAGFDADWQQRAAQLQISAHDFDGARYSLDKALLSKPGYFPALYLKATLERLSGNLDAAEQQAKSLASQRPRDASVQQLLGDIAMQRKRYGDAVQAYRTAYGLEKNAQNAVNVIEAFNQSGDANQALQFAQSWSNGDPADLVAERVLAESYLHAGRLGEARRQYESLAKKLPNDADILHGLAYLMLKNGEVGALPIAEKAYGLAPRDAGIEDTYGWALVQTGEFDKGLRYLREAQVRAPNDPEIQGHLAEALKRKGQTR